jgi:hypothetical protein
MERELGLARLIVQRPKPQRGKESRLRNAQVSAVRSRSYRPAFSARRQGGRAVALSNGACLMPKQGVGRFFFLEIDEARF